MTSGPHRRRVAVAALALGAVLLTTGTLHFVAPGGFEKIVPTFLGSPAFWVYASGVAELACAIGLALPRARRLAGWATAALFVIVFPGNVTMAVHAWHGDGSKLIAYGRLPLQIPLILWAIYVAGEGHISPAGRRAPAPPPAPQPVPR